MTFEAWFNSTEILKTYEVNRETERNIYKTPNEVEIIENYVMPYNFLKKSYAYYWVSLTLSDTIENKQLVERYNGDLEQEFYGEEGQMFPIFKSFEDAYNFSMNEKETIIKNFIVANS